MRQWIFIIFACLPLFFTACSASNSFTTIPVKANNITVPSGDNSQLPIWVSEYDLHNNPTSGMGIMGLYEGYIDPVSLSGELTSLRINSQTDTLEVVDITNFLQLAPCTNCVKLVKIGLDADGHAVVSIGIKHPFPAGDPFKPISGRNRADLHVFNVEGILAIESPQVDNYPGLGMTISRFGLLNPDGYTTYLDAYLDELMPTTANAHPYITYFDDYSTGNFSASNPTGFESVTNPPPSGNLVMPMGCDYNVQDYVFNMTGESIQFLFTVGCTYAVSAASKNMRFTPEYRVPQHNKKAASEVHVEVTSNQLIPGDISSTATLTISILDINHGVPVGDGLDQMYADSSVADILTEIPGITTTPQNNFTFIDGNGRDPLNPLRYSTTIENSAGAGTGNYIGLVKVLDSYPAGLNTSPLLNGMDGIKRVDPTLNPLSGLFEITEFATYTTFEIGISLSNTPPVAILTPDPAFVCDGDYLTFDASASTDDGAIMRYEWDWDLPSGDPADFIADETTTDGIAVSPVYTPVGDTFVAVKVFDNGSPELSDIAIVPLRINDPGINLSDDVISIPTSGLSNIDFAHTQDTMNMETFKPYKGMEGLASADGYIYAAFYAEEGSSGGGIYFTRTVDSGSNWDTPVKVASITGGAAYGGCSISAANAEVHIAYSKSGYHPDQSINDGKVYLLSNFDHGNGSFEENVVKEFGNTFGVAHIGLAVDPNDTNNIYVGYGRLSGPSFMDWWYFDFIRISASNSGPAGPYTEHALEGSDPPEDDDNYGIDIAVSPVDSDVYVMTGGAYDVVIYRSDDHGISFPQDAAHSTRFYGGGFYWARDWDLALDPSNGDTYYIIHGCRRISPFPIRVYKSTDGITLTQITTTIVDSVSASKMMPCITVGPDGDVYAAWVDNRSGNYDVYMDHMPPGGSFGTDVMVSQGNTTNERDPEIIITPDGCDTVLVWEENGDQPSGTLLSRRG